MQCVLGNWFSGQKKTPQFADFYGINISTVAHSQLQNP